MPNDREHGQGVKERDGWSFNLVGESLSKTWVMPWEGREERREKEGWVKREEERMKEGGKESAKSQFGIAPMTWDFPLGWILVNFTISKQCHSEENQTFNIGPWVTVHILMSGIPVHHNVNVFSWSPDSVFTVSTLLQSPTPQSPLRGNTSKIKTVIYFQNTVVYQTKGMPFLFETEEGEENSGTRQKSLPHQHS